jgi:hypothetical protein
MRAMWVFVALVFASGCAPKQEDWIDRTLVTVDVTLSGDEMTGIAQGGGLLSTGRLVPSPVTSDISPPASSSGAGPAQRSLSGRTRSMSYDWALGPGTGVEGIDPYPAEG